MNHEQRFEYQRGFQDALRGEGYDDGAVNTQGNLVVLRLTFRQYAAYYAEGYEDGLVYRGRGAEVPVLSPC